LIVNGISKFIVRGNRLIINNIDETDNGRYRCHAYNNYDKTGEIKDYLLNVISKKKIYFEVAIKNNLLNC
jgi:hypothetical protein